MSPAYALPDGVTVYEVGPRDGLQNQSREVPTHVKIRFVDLLSSAHLPVIEVTSFVRPGSIPQLADAEGVAAGISRSKGTRYIALVPNLRGMERAEAFRLEGIALFTAASETFSVKNTNASIAQTFERFAPVVARARAANLWIRGYVSTAFGCPYEGHVPAAAVADAAGQFIDLGVDQVAIGDTIGVATPRQVAEVLGEVSFRVTMDRLALHLHDTRGTALANVFAALQMGVRTFDSSAGGLGGCPYAPGAAGNLATEDLLYMLHGLGIETGVSLDGVVEASAYLSKEAGITPTSKYFQAANA